MKLLLIALLAISGTCQVELNQNVIQNHKLTSLSQMMKIAIPGNRERMLEEGKGMLYEDVKGATENDQVFYDKMKSMFASWLITKFGTSKLELSQMKGPKGPDSDIPDKGEGMLEEGEGPQKMVWF